MIKRLTTFAAVLVALSSLTGVSSSSAQTRHIMIEEFTGSWCGWCPRGIVAINQLEETSAGKVIPVAIHISSSPDPMENAQGDSLAAGISTLSAGTRVPGFPNGWTSRIATAGSWLSDPSVWHDSVNNTGTVDHLLTSPAQANVTVDNVTFDPTTHMINARLNVNFVGGMTGDVRMNMYVTEDSVSGGTEYNQANYYSQNASYPLSPFFNLPGEIPGWQHMHVFRGAATTVWGAKGIIPTTVQGGASYSQNFSFPLPGTVMDPNHVHLVGFVHQYSTTDISKNQILDAQQVPLSKTAIPIVKSNYTITPNDGYYLTAKSNGDTTETFLVFNSGSEATKIDLVPDTKNLPAGWSATLTPSEVTVPAGKSANVVMKITSPDKSAFVSIPITSFPVKEGAYGAASSTAMYALSSNTKYGFYYSGTADNAAYVGLPDSMKTHTSIMPLSNDVVSAYTPSNFDMLILGNDPMLDNDGTYSIPPMITSITDMLSAGKKVFVSTNDAMYWAISGASNTSGTSTAAVTSFFNDTLGISYRTFLNRIVNNAYSAFKITGTTDPIGAGITGQANASGAISGADVSVTFDLNSGSKSVPLFYFDTKTVNNAGLRFENAQGGKLVFLNFALNSLANQTVADTIAARSYHWLLTKSAAAVAGTVTPQSNMTAMPNPFIGSTEVRYTAEQGEHSVTFSAVDLLGREVATLPSQNVGGNVYAASFNTADLSAGTYVIVVHSSNGSHEIRVVSTK